MIMFQHSFGLLALILGLSDSLGYEHLLQAVITSNYYNQFFGLLYLAIIMNNYMDHISVSGLQSVQTVVYSH